MRSVASHLLRSCALLCLCLAGCGYGRTEVSGVVTYNDKAITESPMGGTITFYGPDGVPVTTRIDADGKYRAEGVCVGENKVAICYQRTIPKAANKRVPKAGETPVAVDTGSPYLIPDSYVSPTTSELTVTVESKTVYSPKLTGPEITK
jgi:hypothetical protein